MKYLKILLLIISFSSISSASFLLDKNSPVCIEDYYEKNSRIHYQKSDTLKWSSSSEDHSFRNILSGYEYDLTTDRCNMGFALKNGLTYEQFNFLLSFIGLIFGGIFMYFTVHIFVAVGGKK